MAGTYRYTCLECGGTFYAPIKAGPRRQLCSDVCRQRRQRRLKPERVPTLREIHRLKAEVTHLQARVAELEEALREVGPPRRNPTTNRPRRAKA